MSDLASAIIHNQRKAKILEEELRKIMSNIDASLKELRTQILSGETTGLLALDLAIM